MSYVANWHVLLCLQVLSFERQVSLLELLDVRFLSVSESKVVDCRLHRPLICLVLLWSARLTFKELRHRDSGEGNLCESEEERDHSIHNVFGDFRWLTYLVFFLS